MRQIRERSKTSNRKRRRVNRKAIRLLTNDPACPELVLELVAMGKSPLQVFPGGGHSIHIERGDEVAGAIAAFLDG